MWIYAKTVPKLYAGWQEAAIFRCVLSLKTEKCAVLCPVVVEGREKTGTAAELFVLWAGAGFPRISGPGEDNGGGQGKSPRMDSRERRGGCPGEVGRRVKERARLRMCSARTCRWCRRLRDVGSCILCLLCKYCGKV